MEKDTERQVWQRVLGQQTLPGREDLRALELAAGETAAACRHLMKLVKGERIRSLAAGAQTNAACLRGMRRLSGEAVQKRRAIAPPAGTAEKLLQWCYYQTRRAMVEYTARAGDPEFGAVFQEMADREREHCAWIAEMLGELG